MTEGATDSPESEIDLAFRGVRAGSRGEFATWMGLVELPLRRMLRPFARAVDVESVFQEGMLRMWSLAPRLQLQGRNASFRYAWVLLRNLARHEARRLGQVQWLPTEGIEEGPVQLPPAPSDPGLARAIRACLDKLSPKLRAVLELRIHNSGTFPDRILAQRLGMTRNAFVQNVCRARAGLARCLRARGIALEEVLQ